MSLLIGTVNGFGQNIYGINGPANTNHDPNRFYEIFETDTNCGYSVIKTLKVQNDIINTTDFYIEPNGKILGLGNYYVSGNWKEYIYEIDTVNLTTTILHDFKADSINGHSAFNNLYLYNGEYYGVTNLGGTANSGVLFKYNYMTNTYTVLYNFDAQNMPLSSIVVYNNEIYGTKLNYLNSTPGTYVYGSMDVFRYTISTQSLVSVATETFSSTLDTPTERTAYYNGSSNTYILADKILYSPTTKLYSIPVSFNASSSYQTVIAPSSGYSYIMPLAINTTSDSSFYYIENLYYSSTSHLTIKEYKLQSTGYFGQTGFSYSLINQATSGLTYQSGSLYFYSSGSPQTLYSLNISTNTLSNNQIVYYNYNSSFSTNYPYFESYKIINGYLFSCTKDANGFSVYNVNSLQNGGYKYCNFFMNAATNLSSIQPISSNIILCFTDNGLFEFNKTTSTYTLRKRYSAYENGYYNNIHTIQSNQNNRVYFTLGLLQSGYTNYNIAEYDPASYSFAIKTSGQFNSEISEPVNGRLFGNAGGTLYEYNILGNAFVSRVGNFTKNNLNYYAAGNYCMVNSNAIVYTVSQGGNTNFPMVYVMNYDIANNASIAIDSAYYNTNKLSLLQSTGINLFDNNTLLLSSSNGFYGNGSLDFYDLTAKTITKVYDYFPSDGPYSSNSIVINGSKVIGDNSYGGQQQVGSLYNLPTSVIPQTSLTICHDMDTTSFKSGFPSILKCYGCIIGNSTSGIYASLSLNNRTTIYPNPNNGSFIIETSSPEQQNIKIYDVTGKLVLNQSIYGRIIIDANDLNAGIYNVTIFNSIGTVNRKMVIVK